MIRAALLFMLLALAPPAVAADLPDPGAVIDKAMKASAADDMEGAYEALAEGLQAARTAGNLSPDWGIVFAMMTDAVRNMRENPAYALMLAEEGLAVVAPNAAEAQDVIAILNVSRSYALADLGRTDEAAAIGRLAEPQLRANLGDKIADDYLVEIAAWEEGSATAENGVSPMGLAGRSRSQAGDALDVSDYARALTLAAQAVLPLDTGLPQDEVILNNADAMRLTGRALYALGRKDEALDALLQGAGLVLGPDWLDRDPLTFAVPVAGAEDDLTDLLIWLSRTLMDTAEGDPAYLHQARRVADLADRLTPGGPTTFTTAYIRATLDMAEGKPDAARAEMQAMAVKARAEGLQDYALLSEFYVQTQAAAAAETADGIDADALIAAASAAIAFARANPASIIDAGFVAGETARFLAMTDHSAAALDFARQGFQARVDWLAASGSAGLGEEAYRRNTRALAEALLQAASRMDGARPGAICSDVAGVGCVIIVESPANSPG